MGILRNYLKNKDDASKETIEKLWEAAKIAIPGSEEGESYGVPTLRYKGKSVIGFAVHASHIGMYPFSPAVITEAGDILYGREVSKGAVRFTVDAPLSVETVRQIVALRLKEIDTLTTK